MNDIELQNHILFLQQAQTYLLLKYAIKHADIGLIQWTVARCCIYFHGSGQHKYAYEMLYLYHFISTSAASSELQWAILANSFINCQDAVNSWFEINKLVKFHNGILKILFQDKYGSAITLVYLLKHCALNTKFFAIIAHQTESLFSINQNSDHSEKSTKLDITIIAQRFSRTGSVAQQNSWTTKYKAIDML